MRLLCYASIFSCLLLFGCASNSAEKNADWYFQIAAPKNYDIWVEHLEFELSGDRHWYHPVGGVSCCWRGPSGPTGVLGGMEPFPNYIGVQWFSFAEKKFYQRLISVSPDWKLRMADQAKYITPMGTHYGPRNILALGFAPGGIIVVWIKNQIGNEIEVARLQANEIEGDASVYKTRVSDYMERSGEYLETHGIPLEGW